MYVTFCGKFVPNERGVVGYVKRIRGKSPAKWGVQMAEMNFQTGPRQRPVHVMVGCLLKLKPAWNILESETCCRLNLQYA
ncbi:DUF6783 domain-containing protein [Hungatella sp. SB206]|uniref:DUF6783 domain-containing protein n=1 Tax=Hungatella sp. SB206 TaxID=2937758 RepID=UPI003DA82744